MLNRWEMRTVFPLKNRVDNNVIYGDNFTLTKKVYRTSCNSLKKKKKNIEYAFR